MAQLLMWRGLIVALVFVTKAYGDGRRPIWNIAHMVNSLGQVDQYLDRGANSVEFDVSFDVEGSARLVFHGFPCDCFRRCMHYEDFDTFLNYLRQITTPGGPLFREELILLFLDLKLSGLSPGARYRAGKDVAAKLLQHYWKKDASGARAYILISVPSYSHLSFIKGLRSTFEEENATSYNEKIGFDFSGNEDISHIRSAVEAEDIRDHIWLGDGITNCLPRGTSRLLDCLAQRDQTGKAYLNKVYWWTVDRMSTMRRTLELGVDGMITNYPERLISILNEDGISSYVRLANFEDNPWDTHSQSFERLMNLSQQTSEDNLTEEILWN